MSDARRTCVLLAIGVQEKEIQFHQSLETKGHMYGGKAQRTCVLLAIGEQERQNQNPQVLSISSKSGDKKKSDP